MILLIIEFLLMSRFLNNIMNQEQKKMNIIKNSITKNTESKGEVIALHDIDGLEEPEQKPTQKVHDKNREIINHIIPLQLKRTSKFKKNSGLSKLKNNWSKIKDLKDDLDYQDIVEQTQKENQLSVFD